MQTKLVCPDCHADADFGPVAIATEPKGFERYHCSSCGSDLLTEELIRKVLMSVAYGRGGGRRANVPFNFSSIVSVGGSSFYDLTMNTSSLTSSQFSVSLGDTVIVCIGHDGCGVLENRVRIGTMQGQMAVGLASEISLCASIWWIQCVTSSSAVVTVEWDAIPPVTAAMTITKVPGLTLDYPVDVFSSGAAAHGQFDTTPSSGTTPLLNNGTDLVIANIVGLTQSTDTPLVWGSGFTGTQSKGTASNATFDIVVNEGRKQASNTSSVVATGTLPYETSWTACVASFYHG